MKKLLALIFVAVLSLGLAASTYATEVNITGDWFTMTGWWLNAMADELQEGPDDPASIVNTGFDDIGARVRSRARIKFEALVSEDLRGVIYFEMGEGVWGDPKPSIGVWGGDAEDVEVKHAYVDFKIPGTDAFPTRVKVGVQDFFMGGPFALDWEGAGVTLDTQAGPANVQLLWIKQDENTSYEADDVDGYGLGVSFPIGPVTPEVWTLYNTMGKGALQAVGPILIDTSGYSWHFGARVNGKVGPATIEGDFAYGMADIDFSIPFMSTGWLGQPVLYSGHEYSGFALHFKGSVPIAMLEVGGEFLYTSGDDLQDIDNDLEFGYRIPLTDGAVIHPTVVYYSSVTNWNVGLTGVVAPTIGGAGLAGDWVAGAFATVKPLDWLSVTVKGMYIGDNVENGDRFGTAVDFLGFPEDNDSAGIEFDLITKFQIYENLSYEIAGGYLFAGDALDQFDQGATTLLGINTNESPKNPWAVVSNLSFSF